MKYKVINSTHHLLFKFSGDTRKNEALFVKRQLFPYLRKIGIMVIIDLSGLEEFEPAVNLGVLYGIKKEVSLNNGELKLCSLDPKIAFDFKESRLDRLFKVYADLNTARKPQEEKSL